MNALNRTIFQVLFFSVLINWITLYLVQRESPIFNWPVVAFVMVASLAISALVARRLRPNMMKVKFHDRSLFFNDLIKATNESEFHPSASMDNHFFFKRTTFFPPQIDTVHLQILEDNEGLITFSPMAARSLKKHMQPYTLLREREFLKETDELMRNT